MLKIRHKTKLINRNFFKPLIKFSWPFKKNILIDYAVVSTIENKRLKFYAEMAKWTKQTNCFSCMMKIPYPRV